MSVSTTNKWRKGYVPTTALAKSVEFSDEMMQVTLMDGRILSVPIIWFPSLFKAKPEERNHCIIRLGGRSLRWPDLDEDLTVAGLLAGGDAEAS